VTNYISSPWHVGGSLIDTKPGSQKHRATSFTTLQTPLSPHGEASQGVVGVVVGLAVVVTGNIEINISIYKYLPITL
jgi:hypothetical protein